MQISKKQILSAIPPFTVGMTSVILQILLTQELTAGFYGNELSIGFSLAFWLIWSAAGSGLLPRIRKSTPDTQNIIIIQLIWILAAAGSLLYIRAQNMILHLPPGELPGIVPMFFFTASALAPVCLLSGYLYTLMCRWQNIRHLSFPASRVYLLESSGAAAGGIIVTLLLVYAVSPLRLFLFLLILNGFSALIMSGFKKLPGLALLICTGLLGWKPAGTLQHRIDKMPFPDQTVLRSRNTPYGQVTLTSLPGQINIYQNGTWLYTVPDRLTAETKIHFAMLQHPQPEHVLIISGGPEMIQQALAYASVRRIDYLEVNPFLIRLWPLLPGGTDSLMYHAGVHVYHQDARRFLNSGKKQYDVIISNLPNPSTNELNRFYTCEFFRQISTRLNPDGIFCFHVQASENVINPDLADYLSMLSTTVRSVFPDLTILPGETQHWVISKKPGSTIMNPDTLESRIRKWNLQTLYVQPYYFRYEYSPERIADVQNKIRASASVNKDFSPLGYHYDTVLWATYFSAGFKNFYLRIHSIRMSHWAGMIILFFLAMLYYSRRQKKAGLFWLKHSILITGFTEISLEIILILAFQILWGAAFKALSILIAVYMAGLTAGSLIAIRFNGDRQRRFSRFKQIQGLMTLHIGLNMTILVTGQRLSHTDWSFAAPVLIGILMAVSGGLGGYQFIQANGLVLLHAGDIREAGALYGLDLLGSSAGALFISAFLIPILGIYQCLFLLLLLNGGTWLLLRQKRLKIV